MDERKRWVAEMARSAPQYAADFLDEIPFGKLEGPVREANLTELKHHVADRRGVFVVHQCAFAPYRGDRPGPVVATRSFEAAEVAAKFLGSLYRVHWLALFRSDGAVDEAIAETVCV